MTGSDRSPAASATSAAAEPGSQDASETAVAAEQGKEEEELTAAEAELRAKEIPFVDELFEKLKELGIPTCTTWHRAAHTIDDWQKIPDLPAGTMAKNLFLKDKKKLDLWLVIVLADTRVDMRWLERTLNVKKANLRLANDDMLFDNLKVREGSVSVLAIAHDKAKKVGLIIDKALVDLGDDGRILCHPMSNHGTLPLRLGDLRRYLEHYEVVPQVLDITGNAVTAQ